MKKMTRKGKGSNEDPPKEAKSNNELPNEWKASKDHPLDSIIGDISKGVTTRHSLKELCNNMAFVSMIEPKNIKEAIIDDNCIIAMQEELNQFERNNVWELVVIEGMGSGKYMGLPSIIGKRKKTMFGLIKD